MAMRSKLLTFGLPVVALLGAAVGAVAVTSNRPTSPVVQPANLPPTQPAAGLAPSYVGATGLVEAHGRNVSIGSSVAGVVVDLMVSPGQAVKRGEPLFRVDDRELQAQLAVRNADIQAALRTVEVDEASVAEAKANLADRQAQLARARAVDDPRAVSAEEIALRRFAVDAVAAQGLRAQAQVRRARAAVEQAQALGAQARTAVARAVARSPQDGTVLQVNVRPGQFAPAGETQSALVVIGNTHPLNLRVDVDEVDVPRLMMGEPAIFSVRGQAEQRWSARFVRVEPLLVGKTNLSGAANERVDTRVLQVIYAFDPEKVSAFVGQQVDVFLPAKARPPTTAAAGAKP
jgi:multidrug resistance efflux pump